MNIQDIIIGLVILIILGLAVFKIIKEKKKDTVCMGCPYHKECVSCPSDNHKVK